MRSSRRFNLSILAVTVGLAACCVAPRRLFAQASGEVTFEQAIGSAFDVGGDIEHLRTLPDTIELPSASIDVAAWLQLGTLAILNIAGTDTQQSPRATWTAPEDPYPTIQLDAAVYGTTLARPDYLAFLQRTVAEYPDDSQLPSTFDLSGASFRYVDTVHLVASLLRFYAAFGYLPPVVDPKIATTRGLFAWDVPAGMEAHLSAFQNGNAQPYTLTNEYYKSSVLDFAPYALVRDLVGSESDPYVAGERIYDWSLERYYASPYGLNYDIDNLTGFVEDSWEMVRYMQGTSGKPSLMNRGLYPSAGLVHGHDFRGYGGALYTPDLGWYNAEIHARYGEDLSNNHILLFQGNEPIPQDPRALRLTANAGFLSEIRETTALTGGMPSTRAFWINASDVLEWGAEVLVAEAVEGGFTSIVLTVKSFVGRLYFDTGAADNIGWDALRPLVTAAAPTGIDVLAAFNVLTDFESGMADVWGQRYFYSTQHNDFFMSPCAPAYRVYLKRLISALYARYAVDGIVLARNYVHSNAWANPECGMSALADDAVKEDYVAGFANTLAAHAKSVRSNARVLYVTAPLMGNYGSAEDDISHDATASKLNASSFDAVVLALHGFAWLTDELDGQPVDAKQVRDGFIEAYDDATRIPLMTMVHLSKEWMYAPAFYRGLARAYAAQGLSGVVLTAVNSPEGEFGPAFEKQHFSKLRHIRFADAPPTPEVVTSRDEFVPRAVQTLWVEPPYPNPARDEIQVAVHVLSPGPVVASIYDIVGREVAVVSYGAARSGRNELRLDTSMLPGGVYVVQIRSQWGSDTTLFTCFAR